MIADPAGPSVGDTVRLGTEVGTVVGRDADDVVLVRTARGWATVDSRVLRLSGDCWRCRKHELRHHVKKV